MNRDFLLQIIRAIVAQPTAPFHEDAVRAEIATQLSQCPHVRLRQDNCGNLFARYGRSKHAAPQLAFVAHMDHPGFVGDRFFGSVPEEYLQTKAPTRSFGPFAMWDLPECELRDGRIHSRACDDLVGCAVIVALLHSLEEHGAECCLEGIFTRAEEPGFLGAIHLAHSGEVDRSVPIISLETSSEKFGGVRMAEGAIVRVGDKTSIFDPAITRALTEAARTSAIPFQRALMSGGTCEGTAFQLYGYRTAALCVALGNYHNCGPDLRIESEYVSLDDVHALAQLCFAAAALDLSSDPFASLREKLDRTLEEHHRLLRPSTSAKL